MTVDWTRWMTMTEAQQKALWAEYRAIVAAEINRAKLNNWQRFNDALWGRRVPNGR